MSDRPEWWLKITRRFFHPDFIIWWLRPLRPIVGWIDRVVWGV